MTSIFPKAYREKMETPAEVVVDHRLAERGDFRMVNAMKELGLAGTTPPCPLDRAATYEERIAYFNAAEAGYQKAFVSEICFDCVVSYVVRSPFVQSLHKFRKSLLKL